MDEIIFIQRNGDEERLALCVKTTATQDRVSQVVLEKKRGAERTTGGGWSHPDRYSGGADLGSWRGGSNAIREEEEEGGDRVGRKKRLSLSLAFEGLATSAPPPSSQVAKETLSRDSVQIPSLPFGYI